MHLSIRTISLAFASLLPLVAGCMNENPKVNPLVSTTTTTSSDEEPLAEPCDDSPCLAGYTCENDGDVAVCTQDPPPPVDPCTNMACGFASHCESDGANAICVDDADPTSIDCALSPETPDETTAAIITQQRFLLPEDTIPNNNGWVGPFCCTGHTAVVEGANANPMAYAYFFGWEDQAYNIGTTSYVSDVTIFVAGRIDPKHNPQSSFIQNAIHFTTEEIASCMSRTVWAGAFRITATPRHSDVWRPFCLDGELGHDMGTLTFVIDVKYGYENY